MKPYVGYIRVSTARQGEGVSLEQQKSAIEAHARVHDLKIVRWFEEKESASKRGRRVFNEMVRELETDSLAGVVIHKIDRSARHLADWVWVGELIDHGIDVRFAHENLDLTTRSGRLTGDMLAVIAADYSRNLREEVKKGLYGRLKQGIYPFKSPVGYLDCGGGKLKAVDPVKAPLVRLAFELYASRRYSLETLRHELHRRGLRQRSGGTLTLEAVSTLLNNPFYIGLMRIQRTGQVFDGRHPPIVPKALFDRVQRILRDRTNTRVLQHDFMLRRMLRCAACGYGLTGETQKGHVYYRCHTATCQGVSIREEDALIEMRWFHELIRFSEPDLEPVRSLAIASRSVAAAQREAEQRRIQCAIGHCDERLARLTDAVVDLLIDKQAYEQRKATLLNERRALLEQVDRPDDRTQEEQLLEKFELGTAAYLGVISLVPEELREALAKTTSNLLVEGKYLVIKPRFPFAEIAKRRILSLGGHYPNVLRTDGSLCRFGSKLPLRSEWRQTALVLARQLIDVPRHVQEEAA